MFLRPPNYFTSEAFQGIFPPMRFLACHLVLFLLTSSILGQADVQQIVDNANRIFYEGKFANAVIEISKLVTLEPKNPRSYLIRARFQKASKDEVNFYKDLDKAIELSGGELTTVLSVSRYLIQTGKKSDCERIEIIITQSLLQNSQSAEGFAMRSQSKSCLGDVVGAFNDMSTASALDPKNSDYSLAIASLLSRLGDSKQALDLYDSYIRDMEAKLGKLTEPWERDDLKIRIAALYQSRSNIHGRNGNQTQMIADMSRAVDIIENPATIHARSLMYAKARRYAEAIADLTREIKIRSGDFTQADSPPAAPLPLLIRKNTREHISRLFVQRGDLYFLEDRFMEAIADYEQAIKLDPDSKERLTNKITNAKARR